MQNYYQKGLQVIAGQADPGKSNYQLNKNSEYTT